MHPLAATECISVTDSWLLGIFVGDEYTGSAVVDNALYIMSGGKLSAPVGSQSVLDLVEPWIAYRPEQAWAWFDLHPVDWRKNLGGWIQAAADQQGIGMLQSQFRSEVISNKNRQLLEMESFARQVGRGGVPASDSRFKQEIASLPAPVCAAYLAACANLDPVLALNLSVEAFHIMAWESLAEVIKYSVQQGLLQDSHKQVIKMFLTEQLVEHKLLIDAAAWIEIASFSRLYSSDEIRLQISSLAEKVADVLDPDELWMAAIPLIRASLYTNSPQVIYSYLEDWAIAPWQIINILIKSDIRTDEAWELVERSHYKVVPEVVVPDWWRSTESANRLSILKKLIREKLMSGAAENMPCQQHLLWRI